MEIHTAEKRLSKIREAEKRSHEEIYSSATLFEGDTWLKKPINTVLELLPHFKDKNTLRVLDLGCGIGRNCIPIAQAYRQIDCRVDCVDILNLAINQLYQYSEKYQVRGQIHGFVMPLEDYSILEKQYDLILAVSALEHVKNEETFFQILETMSRGLRPGGIVCLVMNSNVTEVEKTTGLLRDPQFEVNLPTERLISGLESTFSGWRILKQKVSHQQYDIPRDTPVILTTDVVTWVAQK